MKNPHGFYLVLKKNIEYNGRFHKLELSKTTADHYFEDEDDLDLAGPDDGFWTTYDIFIDGLDIKKSINVAKLAAFQSLLDYIRTHLNKMSKTKNVTTAFEKEFESWDGKIIFKANETD